MSCVVFERKALKLSFFLSVNLPSQDGLKMDKWKSSVERQASIEALRDVNRRFLLSERADELL